MVLPRAALLVVFSVAFYDHTTRGLVMMTTAPLDRSKTKVCVTGANGYVAAELVQQLLSKGYHVRGTVRSLSNRARYSFLDAMAAKSGATLELFEADLQVPGSFDAAVDGCTYVFHVASPVMYTSEDPENDLVKPAVEGVANVLESVAKAKAKPSSPFKRLVLTSSTGAIFGPGSQPKNGKVFTAEDWNEVSSLAVFPYYYSKVLAERKAWELSRAHKLDMVTVHPAYVWGPPAAAPLASTLNLQRLAGILSGEQAPWTFDFPVCDSRDIAAVHIRAAEVAGAKGRYIVSTADTVTPKWFAACVAKQFPTRFPKLQKVDDSIGSKPLLDPSRTEKELGVKLTPPEATLVDTIQALLDGEHVPV